MSALLKLGELFISTLVELAEGICVDANVETILQDRNCSFHW